MKFIVKTQLLLAFIFVSNFAMAQDLPTEYASILSKYQKDFYDITFTDFPTLPVSRPQVLKYSAQVSVNQDKYNEFITEIRDLFRRNDIESTPFNATVNSENSWRHTDRKKEFAGYRSWDPEKTRIDFGSSIDGFDKLVVISKFDLKSQGTDTAEFEISSDVYRIPDSLSRDFIIGRSHISFTMVDANGDPSAEGFQSSGGSLVSNISVMMEDYKDNLILAPRLVFYNSIIMVDEVVEKSNETSFYPSGVNKVIIFR